MTFLSKNIFAGVILLLSSGLIGGFAEAGESRSPTVVELYTSQGCSSCPPADAYLGELAKMEGVLALSFHVDYWDYIGWKDPFAAPINSQRQQEYSRIFRKAYVYTPQIIIHGMAETTGSNKAVIKARIEQAKLAPDVPIKLERQASGDLRIRIARGRQPGQATIWMAYFDPVHETKIRRGENRGEKISNHNVVRVLKKIGDWRGQRIALTISAAELKKHQGQGCAVFLQSAQKGPILGAASLQLVENVN
jgi:hypothetical protein